MPSYVFQGALHRNAREMLDAIAEAWLTGDGWATKDDQLATLTAMSDLELATECIETLGLDQPDPWDTDARAHTVSNRYADVDLAAAFARLRATLCP
jgi:hypothetical protein